MSSAALSAALQRSTCSDRIDYSAIPTLDLPEPLVPVASTDALLVQPIWTVPDDFEGHRYCAYIAENPDYDGILLRESVAAKLSQAAQNLPPWVRLVIRAGHRPIEVQRQVLADCVADHRREHPHVSASDALEHARMFVSDPDIMLPPHVCAAAVDVELQDRSTGTLLDFGSRLNSDTRRSFLHHPDLSRSQRAHRLLLLRSMLAAGFASCQTEWWHFSFGDQVWAWFYRRPSALFGLAHWTPDLDRASSPR